MAISLKFMRYVVTTIERGSIATAAKELNVAASAVASAIDQVETQLGLTLINRHRSRGITPTSSGKVMAQKFTRLLDDYEAIMSDGHDLKNAMKGSLRIGYYAPVAPAFLPNILRDLAQGQTGITLHLVECDNTRAQTGLLAGDFDVALFVSDIIQPRVAFEPLIQAPAFVLLAAHHKLTERSALTLSDLAQEPIIVLDRPAVNEYYQGLLGATGKTPAAYANSTEMVRSLVGAGHGCAILNMLPNISNTYAGDGVVARPLLGDILPLTLSIGYNHGGTRRIVSQFIDQVRTYFNNDAGLRHLVRPNP